MMQLETFFTVPEQTRLLIFAVLLGIPLGVVFDVLRTLRLLLPHGKLAAVWGIPLMGVNTGRLGFMANLEAAVGGSTALFFHRAGTGRIPRLLCHGQRTGIFAVPLYAGLCHSAPSGTGSGGDFRQFAATVSPAFPRCCAYLHSVAPEIWTFRQTFSKSIFFFAFTLAER